jgi:hypothetical protein
VPVRPRAAHMRAFLHADDVTAAIFDDAGRGG